METAFATEVRRLNINLPVPAYQTLQDLAKRSNRTMTDVVKIGLSLAKVAMETEGAHNKLAVVNSDGKVLKEIVLLGGA